MKPESRRRNLSRRTGTTGLALAMYVVFAQASCIPDPTGWYPEGRAEIVSFWETMESETKVCVVCIGLTNTGATPIGTATISISVETDRRTYHRTVEQDVPILAGGIVYVQIYIPYVDPGERVAGGGISVVSEFYRQ